MSYRVVSFCVVSCRALIGHLALNHDANRERLGSAGAIENMVMILQKHSTNMGICTEVCWALRNVAHTESNRERMANELVPETLAAVLKTHLGAEVFVKEAIRAIVACISNEVYPPPRPVSHHHHHILLPPSVSSSSPASPTRCYWPQSCVCRMSLPFITAHHISSTLLTPPLHLIIPPPPFCHILLLPPLSRHHSHRYHHPHFRTTR